MIFDSLQKKIIEMQNPTCVGLDTSFSYLPEEMRAGVKDFSGVSEAILTFNKTLIDNLCDLVPAVKVQIAYYEAYGAAGLECFQKTCEYARNKGLFVIADCKRNDIGATASRYAEAYLGEGEFGRAFPADLLTVNGYLGTDGIAPFLEECKKHDGGIFVLVKTSNPSSGELQDLKLENGCTVYEYMGDLVEQWGEGTLGEYGFSRVGAVVGATYPEEAKILREKLEHTFFLIPGYGAQGGKAETLKNCFKNGGWGGIVNNSRGILCAYQKRGGSYFEAARAAAVDMKKDLLSALGEICAK